MLSNEMILSSITTILILIIFYFWIRLKKTLTILENIDFTQQDDEIPRNKKNLDQELASINETKKILQTNIKQVPEEIISLKKELKACQKNYLKQKEKNKNNKEKIAKYMAKTIKKSPIFINGINLYYKEFEIFYDEEIVKKTHSKLKKENNSVVLLLFFKKNKFFLILSCSEDMVDKGFNCEKVVTKMDKISDGGFGGTKSFAMIKSESIEIEKDFVSKFRLLVEEEIKDLSIY